MYFLSKVHKCNDCQKEFARANHLKRHQTSHSPIKPFRCASCPKSFNRRDHLNQHEKLHQRTNDYECDVCEKPFSRADHLAKHKASKHGIGEKICVSKIINMTFWTKYMWMFKMETSKYNNFFSVHKRYWTP